MNKLSMYYSLCHVHLYLPTPVLDVCVTYKWPWDFSPVVVMSNAIYIYIDVMYYITIVK